MAHMTSERLAVLLDIIMKHADCSNAGEFFCCIAPVCTAWHTATAQLYQPQSMNVIVQGYTNPCTNFFQTMSSLSQWLVNHAGLVRSISINLERAPLSEPLRMQAAEALAHGLKEASGQIRNLSHAGKPLLQLQEYSSDCLCSLHILEVLWCMPTLTSLRLAPPLHSDEYPALPSCSDLALAFVNFQQLKSLSLSSDADEPLSASCVEAMSRLTQLHQLRLGVHMEAGSNYQLTTVLQLIPVQQLTLICTYEHWAGCNLTQANHLTKLQLCLHSGCLGNAAVQLPTQLRALELRCISVDPFICAPVQHQHQTMLLAGVTTLKQLEVFSAWVSHPLPSHVVRWLAGLSTLQDVTLAYNNVRAAAVNQQDWVLLRKLHSLTIVWATPRTKLHMPLHDLQQLLQSIGTLTALTSLQLNSSLPIPGAPRPMFAHHQPDGDDGDDLPGMDLLDSSGNPVAMEVFSHLTNLKQLQQLHVVQGPMEDNPSRGLVSAALVVQVVAGSAKDLSELTGLTSLQLANCRAAVDDSAALTLAASLTRLRCLDVRGCLCQRNEAVMQQLQRLRPTAVDDDSDYEDYYDDHDEEGGTVQMHAPEFLADVSFAREYFMQDFDDPLGLDDDFDALDEHDDGVDEEEDDEVDEDDYEDVDAMGADEEVDEDEGEEVDEDEGEEVDEDEGEEVN